MRRKLRSNASRIERRTVLRTALAWGALETVSPFLLSVRGEEPVKIGMVEPLTGVYARLAASEVVGARLALDEVNHSGGILGREARLLVEDSINEVTVGVAKTRLLIDRDKVHFILGDLNSAIALAMTRLTAEKHKLHIVTGAHIDEITGQRCSWNVFRICKTTTMEANAIADTLVEKFGNRWYFLTPDYAYGYALQAAFERKLREHGGAWSSALLPVGTTDYSRSLVDAEAYQPDVLIDIMGGADQTNSLEQIVRFGLNQDINIGGALFELESILAVPEAARIGWWTMEWWWKQPDNPDVAAFDKTIRHHTGRPASARNWFGYAAVHVLAGIANQEKSLDPVVLARAFQGYRLPRQVALYSGDVFFRATDHQLMSPILVGEVHPSRGDRFDVFTARATVAAQQAADSSAACKLTFPG
jgi:branched-chain amino acid transport system substrate-binding protein